MTLKPYFSSSSKVWEPRNWIYGIEEAGYAGWEIVADGRYRFDNPGTFREIREELSSTGLAASVHAPYSDLNLASVNYPIWRESVGQICTCIEYAAELTDRVMRPSRFRLARRETGAREDVGDAEERARRDWTLCRRPGRPCMP